MLLYSFSPYLLVFSSIKSTLSLCSFTFWNFLTEFQLPLVEGWCYDKNLVLYLHLSSELHPLSHQNMFTLCSIHHFEFSESVLNSLYTHLTFILTLFLMGGIIFVSVSRENWRPGWSLAPPFSVFWHSRPQVLSDVFVTVSPTPISAFLLSSPLPDLGRGKTCPVFSSSHSFHPSCRPSNYRFPKRSLPCALPLTLWAIQSMKCLQKINNMRKRLEGNGPK